MKNTMKMKSLLSFFVPAAMMSLMVAGCSDYDNGYDSNAIKFNEEFRKAYGDIDPEQDWNLAERGTVTVSTMKESEVKIYALRGNEYVLVGDYEGVKGTKMLGFDMVEGTQSIMVTDGVTAEKTTPGGVVTFGGTRNVIEGTTNGVKVTKLTSEVKIGDETFPAYRTSNMAEVDKVLREIVPQGQDNIQKVTSDFTYVSTGSFIIYPFYWYTSSENTIGVYYTDANNKYHEVDIYESKGSQHGANNTGELWYLMDDQVLADNLDLESWVKSNESNVQGWTSGKLQKPVKVKTDQQDPSGIVAPFVEYWAERALGNATISKTFTVSPNAECLVEVAARLRNQNGTSTSGLGTVTFTANNQSVELTANGNYSAGTYTYYDDNGKQKTEGNLYSNMNGTGKIMVKCKADSNGKINVSFNLNNVGFNWFSFKDLKIANLDAMTAMGNSEFPGYNLDPNSLPGDMSDDVLAHFFKGQGIRVDIEPGTKFGMYLKKTDGSGSYKFYSESSKNVADTRLHDKYCYASTFYNGDQMFIGLEDWPNGDSDLNDLVLAFSGAKPIIINEEADSWLMVCEDLGGSFDTDYNDVIFKVEHVSGKTTAKVTAMAAGGTLASYIVLNNGSNPQVVGEIHQMLGAAPEKSGEYTPINATSRYDAVGSLIDISVPADFTMAYSTDVDKTGVNMGGFEIRTLNSGEGPAPADATVNDLSNSKTSVIAAPDPGSAPYMLCLPYTYTKEEDGKINTYVWAWPQELCTICSNTYKNGKYQGTNGGAYPDFGAWVSSYSDNRDWYKNPNPAGAMIVEKLLLKSENIQTGELQIIKDLVLADGPNAAVDLSQNVIPAAGGGDVTYNILSLNKINKIPNVGPSFTFSNGAGIVQVIQNGVTKEFTVKFKSPLGNKGNMTVHKANGGTGIQVDLASNLTNANVSSGALSYEYGHATEHDSPTEWLYNKGTRTIIVTQAADDNYVAGSTTFQLTIINDDEGGSGITLDNLKTISTGGQVYAVQTILDYAAANKKTSLIFYVTKNQWSAGYRINACDEDGNINNNDGHAHENQDNGVMSNGVTEITLPVSYFQGIKDDGISYFVYHSPNEGIQVK